ncbi:MAG: type II toxin-antitoxin system VapC family toxin [Hyphomicrobiales bacterium]
MSHLLLDTHVFLWWQAKEGHLGPIAGKAIADPKNRVFVSAVSVLEIVLKARRGKLTFASPVTAAIAVNGFSDLPVRAVEAEFAGGLEWDHSDPFDRLLVAQAIMAPFILVTADNMIRQFKSVPHLWARA